MGSTEPCVVGLHGGDASPLLSGSVLQVGTGMAPTAHCHVRLSVRFAAGDPHLLLWVDSLFGDSLFLSQDGERRL